MVLKINKVGEDVQVDVGISAQGGKLCCTYDISNVVNFDSISKKLNQSPPENKGKKLGMIKIDSSSDANIRNEFCRITGVGTADNVAVITQKRLCSSSDFKVIDLEPRRRSYGEPIISSRL